MHYLLLVWQVNGCIKTIDISNQISVQSLELENELTRVRVCNHKDRLHLTTLQS